MDKLLQQIIAFSNRMHEQQVYLERATDDPQPNLEAAASPAEIVKRLTDELDMIIAAFLVDHALDRSFPLKRHLKAHIQREKSRRVAIAQWILDVSGGEAG